MNGDVSERATSDGPQGAPLGGRAVDADQCGIRRAIAGILDEPWPVFFSQWCRAAELGPVAARQVHDVAGRLARPVALDGDDWLAAGWVAVHDAMSRVDARVPPLEATG